MENPQGAPECEMCGHRLLLAPEPVVLVRPLEVTRSEVEPPPEDTTALWGGPVVDLDSGRAADDGVRTERPTDDGACPFCGDFSLEGICDSCGRRKRHYGPAPAKEEATRNRGGEALILCPSCFSHVDRGARCNECQVPFPPSLQTVER